MNKRAQVGYGLIWLYRIIILTVIVGGVVTIVLIHYAKSYDIRNAEAHTVAAKLLNCIAPSAVVKEFSNASIRRCIAFDEKEFYLNATLGIESIEVGDPFLSTLCKAMERGVKVKKPPACHTSSYLLLNKNRLEKLKLFIAIKKIEKNV